MEGLQLYQEIGAKVFRYERKKDIANVLSHYKLLKYEPSSNRFVGDIELVSDDNIYIDIFSVEIIIPVGFPNCFPKVFEIGGKIPRNPKRHVMPKTNNLCLAVPIEETLICHQGITIKWFLDEVLVPRLCEEYRVNNGLKYQKEYSHDFGGTWEYLMKKFNINDTEVVLNFMKALAFKKTPKGDKPCLCNSGQLYRLCHRKIMSDLQHLGLESLKNIYHRLVSNPYKGLNL